MTQNDIKLLAFIDYETLMDNARAFANAIGIDTQHHNQYNFYDRWFDFKALNKDYFEVNNYGQLVFNGFVGVNNTNHIILIKDESLLDNQLNKNKWLFVTHFKITINNYKFWIDRIMLSYIIYLKKLNN